MDWITLGGWIGPVVGGGVGLLGAIIGTYLTVKNTRGPRERRFAIKACILGWVFVLLFVAGMALLPGWSKLFLVIPYLVVLLFGIRMWNKIQFQIQKEESNAGDGRVAEKN